MPDPAPLAQPPRRALVIKLGHLGDVLLITPVLTGLKEAYPQVLTTVLVDQGTEEMLRHNPAVDELIVLPRDRVGFWAELSRQLGLIGHFRRARFDLSIHLADGDRGAFLSRASGARLRVGMRAKTPRLRERAYHILIDRGDPATHVVETNLGALKALGITPQDTTLKLTPGPEGLTRAAALLARLGLAVGGYALVHPTSRWMFKAWPPERCAQAIGHLAGRGLPVVLSAGPDVGEQEFAGRIKAGLKPEWPVADLSGQLDLATLGALIAGARVFLGMDSVPMHMAAALQTPVVAVFGPSGEANWGPWRVRHRVVTGDCDQRPCGRDGCEGSKVSRCLEELPAERVTEALDQLLEETQAP